MWIIGIVQSFLNATGMVLTKKVVENKKIGNNWQTLISRTTHALILIAIFSLGFLEFEIPKQEINLYNIGLLLLATTALYITYPLRRNAYANEKVSVLQPFAMLFQVFPIIIGFIFIASERLNIITFITALIASIVVIGASIDYKNFKINKWCLMVLISSVIKSTQIFAIIYFLTILSPASLYFTESILVVIFSISLILIKKELTEIKLLTKKYTKLLISSNFIVVTSILLVLTLYNGLGVVATSLLSLLYLVFVYVLGYFILKEIPSKKDIFLTFFIAICVIIGMYAKVS